MYARTRCLWWSADTGVDKGAELAAIASLIAETEAAIKVPPHSWSTQGPSWGYLKVNLQETLSIFGDKRPRNGSKNEEMAPRMKTDTPT